MRQRSVLTLAMSVPGVYKIVLDTDGACAEEDFTGLELEVEQDVQFLAGGERLDSVEILPSQDITYIQVGSGLAGEKVDLFLEYGPSWRSDLLHDLHESCLSGNLFT